MDTKQASLLILLTIISTMQTAVMKYSRQISQAHYIASTSVVMSETIKAIAAYIFLLFENGIKETNFMVYDGVFVHWKTTVLLLVPSILYALQNTLLIVAITNLDAAIYAVTYQFKIVITALLSLVMLKKHLNKYQWMGILLLIPGVSLVQYDSNSDKQIIDDQANPLIGLICILFCSFSSGFAGVYFEKMLKSTPKNNLWIQSIQLCLGSAIIACLLCFKDIELIKEKGFFYGYDQYTWLSVFLNAAGGITIAAVVKVADNIVKGLATSISMVLSCCISILYFDFHPTVYFYIGAILVFIALILYTVFPTLMKRENKERTI